MTLARCNRPQNAPPDHGGHIAVVDSDKILQEIGYKAKFEEADKIRERNLQGAVHKTQKSVQVKLVEETRKIGEKPEAKGDKPTDAEQKLIDEWNAKTKHLDKARLNAEKQIRLKTEERRLINKKKMADDIARITDAIAPLARKIAIDKGLDVVVPTSSVMAHADTLNITADTLKEVAKLIEADSFPPVTMPELSKDAIDYQSHEHRF